MERDNYLNEFFLYLRSKVMPNLNKEIRLPQELYPKFMDRLAQNSALRRISNTQMITTKNDIPIQLGFGSTRLVEEGQVVEEDSKMNFEGRVLKAHPFPKRKEVHEEWLQESGIANFIFRRIEQELSESEEESFLKGGKDTGPRSLINDVLKIQSKAANQITADDTFSLFDGVESRPQDSGTWIMNQRTRSRIRMLKSNDDRHLYDFGFGRRSRETLLGQPVVISSTMPDVEKGKVPILFGDFSWYLIGTRADITIKVSPHFQKPGYIVYETRMRSDAVLTVPEAIAGLQIT